MRVYLDNAATTAIAPEVLEAMMPYLTEHYGNPSAQHGHGREARAAIERSRKSIARHLNAKPSEIIFTSGGTESTNLALLSAVRDMGVKRIITTVMEHHCVLHTIDWLEDRFGTEIIRMKVDSSGFIDQEELKTQLAASNVRTLVSVMHANNEIGVLNDIESIGRLAHTHDAYFHSDTVQTMGHYAFDLQSLEIDFMTGSAHKFHGPKGVGFLFARKGMTIGPLIHGGGQERSKRAGTENVCGIVGMAKALDLCYDALAEDQKHIQGLKSHLLEGLRQHMPEITVNGPEEPDQSLYTVLNISFPPNNKGPLLLFNLDMEGVSASGGSACSSGASAGSHVIDALGEDADRIAIRFSFSRYTTESELDFAIDRVCKVFCVEANS